MIAIICGSRNPPSWGKNDVFRTLDRLRTELPITAIIEGGALGVDRLAWAWARANVFPVARVDAQWKELGVSAGPIRNKWMLAYKPDLVIAFPGGRGTANMVDLAEKNGVRVVRVPLAWGDDDDA